MTCDKPCAGTCWATKRKEAGLRHWQPKEVGLRHWQPAAYQVAATSAAQCVHWRFCFVYATLFLYLSSSSSSFSSSSSSFSSFSYSSFPSFRHHKSTPKAVFRGESWPRESPCADNCSHSGDSSHVVGRSRWVPASAGVRQSGCQILQTGWSGMGRCLMYQSFRSLQGVALLDRAWGLMCLIFMSRSSSSNVTSIFARRCDALASERRVFDPRQCKKVLRTQRCKLECGVRVAQIIKEINAALQNRYREKIA
jgi:hypothetical protein